MISSEDIIAAAIANILICYSNALQESPDLNFRQQLSLDSCKCLMQQAFDTQVITESFKKHDLIHG